MRPLDMLNGALAKLSHIRRTLRERSEFACGDCERVERCGRPPSDKCIVRAAQIVRDGGRPRRAPLTPW